MMSKEDTCDKELLELAAKAAGYTLEEHYDDDQYYPWCTETLAFWNPLLDDGDALRLMVKLGMQMYIFSPDIDDGICVPYSEINREFREYHNNDPLAATRRAIVKAAAYEFYET